MCRIQAPESLSPACTKQCRCWESEGTMYVCQSVRLLICFVVAATLLTISLSVLCILLEGCRRLSGADPFDNRILRVSKCGDKGFGKCTYTVCVCVCAYMCVCYDFVCQCACGCTVEGIEGDWQTNQAPETLSLLQCLLVRLPPPTLCLHLWLCKPPHNVGALKWQWKLWLIFVKTHSLLPRFRIRVQW